MVNQTSVDTLRLTMAALSLPPEHGYVRSFSSEARVGLQAFFPTSLTTYMGNTRSLIAMQSEYNPGKDPHALHFIVMQYRPFISSLSLPGE